MVRVPRLRAMKTENKEEEEMEQDVRVKDERPQLAHRLPGAYATHLLPSLHSANPPEVSHPALLGSAAPHLLPTLDSSQHHTSRQHLRRLRAPRPPSQQAAMGLLALSGGPLAAQDRWNRLDSSSRPLRSNAAASLLCWLPRTRDASSSSQPPLCLLCCLAFAHR